MKTSTSLMLLLAVILSLCAIRTHAQDTSITDKLIRYILQPLDKSQVPTQYLEEYGAPIVGMSVFNGTLSTANSIDMNLWRALYFQLYTGYVGTGSPGIPAITTVNTAIRAQVADSLPVPIPLLIGQYSSVKSNAFTSNLLSYNSAVNKVFDVAGRPSSPYQQNNLFAASPVNASTFSGVMQFVYNPSLVWNNTGKTISAVKVDFADGGGLRTLTANSPLSISYADTGTVRWTIEVTFTDASIWRCYSPYRVFKASAGGSARYANAPDVVWDVPATANHSGARVSITYSNATAAGGVGNTTLDRPFIVVEGYDASDQLPDFVPNTGYRDIVDMLGIDAAGAGTATFNDLLDDAQYDLVVVDFNEGTDDIVRNARLVENVINLVNGAKTGTQQNVVLGISMGGLVSRYALAEMTKASQNPQTRLLITHDSPHRGANVPLGLQHLVHMAGDAELFGTGIREIFPQYDEVIGLLNRPASQQMLLYRATGATTSVGNVFLNTIYRNMVTFAPADPQPAYRFIATSLGSECAQPLFAPSTTLLDAEADAFLFVIPLGAGYRFQTDIFARALPSEGATDEIAHLLLRHNFRLFGLINIRKTVYNSTAYAPGNQLAVDGAPGGVSPVSDVNLPRLNLAFPVPLPPILSLGGFMHLRTAGNPAYFTFIPTASALDANPFSTASLSSTYVGGVNAQFPSSAANFIAQENITNQGLTFSNLVHPVFTPRNSQWLFDQMQGNNTSLNCSPNCNPNYNFAIAGPADVCTSGSFTIPGLPAGTAVAWSISPAGVATLAPTASGVTVTKVQNDPAVLTATITRNCGGTVSINRPVNIGQVRIFEVLGDEEVVRLTSNVYTLTPDPATLPGVTIGSWSIIPANAGSLTNLGVRSVRFRPTLVGAVTIQVTGTAACGTYILGDILVDVYNSLPLAFTVSPNPASGMVSLNMAGSDTDGPSKSTARAASAQASTISVKRTVNIFDASGKLARRQVLDAGSPARVQLDVSGLPNGTYIVEVSDGQRKFTQKMIVQH